MGASSSKVAGDSRPNTTSNTLAAPVDQNMGNVSSGMSPVTEKQQQAMAAATTPLDVVHNLSREEMKNNTPTRPARLGDPIPIDDQVKQAEAMQRVQDAQAASTGGASAQGQREAAAVREGKYSIYNNPVACNRMPNVFPLDDCLRASQHQFFEARQALRYQRQMCLPCNKCYGDYGTNSGGNIAKAFADGNDVRGARTNDVAMSRDVRTMTANMQARQRLLQCNARPSQLEHSEQTTKMSPAAAAIEALASQTTNSAQERNAAAAEAVVVQKSMSPTTAGATASTVTSPAMTAMAAATAAPAAAAPTATAAAAPAMQQQGRGNGSMQTTEMLLNGEIQGGRWSPSAGNMGCGCAGAAAAQKIVSSPAVVCGDNKTNGNGRLVALKRMQQGIQSRQDFCEFDFCPVV